MRKIDKRLNIRKRSLPEEYKKIDTSVNGDVSEIVDKQKEIEKKLYPLRLNNRTVIYVMKGNQNQEYAKKMRIKLGLVKCENECPKKTTHFGTKISLDVGKIRRFIQDGRRLKDIAREFDVSKTTIDSYVKKYNLRER